MMVARNLNLNCSPSLRGMAAQSFSLTCAKGGSAISYSHTEKQMISCNACDLGDFFVPSFCLKRATVGAFNPMSTWAYVMASSQFGEPYR